MADDQPFPFSSLKAAGLLDCGIPAAVARCMILSARPRRVIDTDDAARASRLILVNFYVSTAQNNN